MTDPSLVLSNRSVEAVTVIVAIDDTYGPTGPTKSRFVSGTRRTHVAVVFTESEAAEVRCQVGSCLEWLGDLLPTRPEEFHFADVYNGNGPWRDLRAGARNLQLVEAFCSIYVRYRWPVIVQTVDHRTFRDHGIKGFKGKVDGLDLSDRGDLALFLLCVKLKQRLISTGEKLTLFIDEGRAKRGRPFGTTIFRDWPGGYSGSYASSKDEPLLQIADLLAFCINRSTHLCLKDSRTETDLAFLGMVGAMNIRRDEISPVLMSSDFSVADFDRFHAVDRAAKGLSEAENGDAKEEQS